MLLTRCPECDTTFRVTDETLKKAKGQVRCGRCASVFNAYTELHDAGTKAVETPISSAAASETAAPQAAAQNAERPAAIGADAASTQDPQAISASEVDRVLNVDSPLPQSAYAWSLGGPQRRAESGWWTVAAAAALVALGAQGVHHFRSDIARHPLLGPWLTAAYESLGGEIPPSFDVHQYQIIDWIATAEPDSRGLGSLKITARIQNRGPARQPFPAVQLRLTDRYDAALGSRMFTPAEYLPRDVPRGRLMSPGETTRAELEVVDPGPDAYGFELDVCIEVEPSLVTCGADEVFL
jgi:predicted Zn finger-like uncharacterized protein